MTITQPFKIIRERKRNRMRGFDYSRSGSYFVTICVRDHREVFGEIHEGQLTLNDYGKLVEKHWLEIPSHYQNVQLDEFIVMPNHVHGIIVIANNANHGIGKFVGTEQCSVPVTGMNKRTGLLSTAIKSFKEKCLKQIRNNPDSCDFQWQRSFYDHIIRDEQSLNNIRQYIRDNPRLWTLDRNEGFKGIK